MRALAAPATSVSGPGHAIVASQPYVQCRLAQDELHQRDRAAIGASPAAAVLQGMKGN
jgi:hypothetical protein